MKIEVLTVGDEILSGNIVDTNFAWIGDYLWSHGYELHVHSSVGDDPEPITKAINLAASRSQVVIVTGGLGPTIDDITIETASKAFGMPQVLFPEALEKIKARFEKLNRPMAANNEKQARLPEGSTVIPNDNGTAPGCHIAFQNTHFFFLPGVPREMKKMCEDYVFPKIKELSPVKTEFCQKVLRCFGMTESAMDRELASVDLTDVDLAFRIFFPEILLKISARGSDLNKVQKRVHEVEAFVRDRLGDVIYGEGEEMLPQWVGRVLTERGESLSVAESCTGGLLASLITDVPGSSKYFKEGVVTYSNESKQDLLAVPSEVLKNHGAVSAETAIAMAEGLRKRAGTTYALSMTGIAGPDGGSPDKPVGTVHIALSSPSGTQERKLFFPASREWFKRLVAFSSLDILRKHLIH
ncbi:MAG: competence/damage-inducible protein A [Deltaproteobacteria bacterium]|nr:MAG: competence/damage-inducible protein A [Deltaproteobacteria bacterium]